MSSNVYVIIVVVVDDDVMIAFACRQLYIPNEEFDTRDFLRRDSKSWHLGLIPMIPVYHK